jgi:hypothetical protein
LLPIFEALLNSLNQCLSQPDSLERIHTGLACSEAIFSWDFENCYNHVLSNPDLCDVDVGSSRGITLTAPWRPIILSPAVLELYFKVYDTNIVG